MEKGVALFLQQYSLELYTAKYTHPKMHRSTLNVKFWIFFRFFLLY